MKSDKFQATPTDKDEWEEAREAMSMWGDKVQATMLDKDEVQEAIAREAINNWGDKVQATLTDSNDELEEAREAIRYLKLQLKLKDAQQNVETQLVASPTVEMLKKELDAVRTQHAEEVTLLQQHVAVLQKDMAALQKEHQQEVERHKETLEKLSDVLRSRQQEHYQTLNDFTAKLVHVGAIHKDAIEIHKETIRCLEIRHREELAQQRAELLADMFGRRGRKETRDPPTKISESREADSVSELRQVDWRDTTLGRTAKLKGAYSGEETQAKASNPKTAQGESAGTAKLKGADAGETQANASKQKTGKGEFPISKITIEPDIYPVISQISSFEYAE